MRELEPNSAGCLSLNQAIRLVDQGDPKAFEFIYRSYCGLVHRICLRILGNPVDAEDAAQDVFVRVFCKINTFRGESAFSSWLYRVATNTVLMRFRKNKHSLTLEEPGEVNAGLSSEANVTHAERDSISERIDLQAAINVLPNGYKRAFLLHDVQGYAHREIAEIFGYSIGCSKSQLHKARKLLRELLRDMPKNRVPQRHKTAKRFCPLNLQQACEQHCSDSPVCRAGSLDGYWSPRRCPDVRPGGHLAKNDGSETPNSVFGGHGAAKSLTARPVMCP